MQTVSASSILWWLMRHHRLTWDGEPGWWKILRRAKTLPRSRLMLPQHHLQGGYSTVGRRLQKHPVISRYLMNADSTFLPSMLHAEWQEWVDKGITASANIRDPCASFVDPTQKFSVLNWISGRLPITATSSVPMLPIRLAAMGGEPLENGIY